MEQEYVDLHLARALKNELSLEIPPANGKARLLSQAGQWIAVKNTPWLLLPKRSQNLYRVHVYRGPQWFELDNLAGSIEFRLFNYQHLVA